jgi:putative membrane protein
MAEHEFFTQEARRRVGQVVGVIESGTAAEIVVTVRRTSGSYRQTDLWGGLAVALAMLVFLLFDPHPFDVGWMPVNVLVAFILGAVITLEWRPLRRALTPGKLLGHLTKQAARASFYDLGVSRTSGRTGVLVYVSMFERLVEVVPDIGVKPDAMGADWVKVVAALSSAISSGPDIERFVTALESLQGPLSSALPAQPGDVNELPDEPVVA